MTVCANPACTNPLPPRRRGRPPIYCTPRCRPSYQRPTLHVDVAHPDQHQPRPRGHHWTVTLRRGHRAAVIATDLGWASATTLADQIRLVIDPLPTGTSPRLEHPRAPRG
jgi:hypothetical protein